MKIIRWIAYDKNFHRRMEKDDVLSLEWQGKEVLKEKIPYAMYVDDVGVAEVEHEGQVGIIGAFLGRKV